MSSWLELAGANGPPARPRRGSTARSGIRSKPKYTFFFFRRLELARLRQRVEVARMQPRRPPGSRARLGSMRSGSGLEKTRSSPLLHATAAANRYRPLAALDELRLQALAPQVEEADLRANLFRISWSRTPPSAVRGRPQHLDVGRKTLLRRRSAGGVRIVGAGRAARTRQSTGRPIRRAASSAV